MVYRDDPEALHVGTGEFRTLRKYVSVIEAECDRAALESAGFDVRLCDVGTAAIIPHGGVALGVRLQVRESELDRARELLDKPDPIDESERAAHRELRKPEGLLASEMPAGWAPRSELASNEGTEAWRRQVAVDAEAARAFRAAVIGLFVCPGIGQLYAASLVVRLWPRRRELSRSGRWNLAGALSVIVLIACAYALIALRA